MSAVDPLDTDVFLTARAVRRRYGDKSDMALWRWSRDPSLGFPAPIYIQQFRYWRLADLLEWERSRPTTNPNEAA
jgi:aromatic ring-cleaving dioxygenase